MEVADRTEADRKGGHVARRREGDGLVLREIAQTPDEDVDAFQDIEPAPLLQHEHAVGRPAARCARCSTSATACSACR